MKENVPTYEEAVRLLKEYTSNPRHLEHACAVEAAMAYLAQKYGDDTEKWRIIGLVHDLDTERYPGEHCIKTGEILKAEGWPAEYIHAVQSHGWGTWCDVRPELRMEKFIYTMDKLTWFVGYVTVKQPSRKLADVSTRIVMERWADETFAPGRNREFIKRGAAMLGIDIEELVGDAIAAMLPVANKIGL
jgi:predicted hydrolase (HD superfamily)